MQRIAPTFLAMGGDELSRLAQAAGNAVPRLWQGYLAPGNLTLLTGQWTCGKTTLLAALLAQLTTGGPLAGLPVAPGKAVVVSDESPQHWQQRAQRFHFGPTLRWLCQPFANQPSFDEWLALIDHLAGFRTADGTNLTAKRAEVGQRPGRLTLTHFLCS